MIINKDILDIYLIHGKYSAMKSRDAEYFPWIKYIYIYYSIIALS